MTAYAARRLAVVMQARKDRQAALPYRLAAALRAEIQADPDVDLADVGCFADLPDADGLLERAQTALLAADPRAWTTDTIDTLAIRHVDGWLADRASER